MPREYCVLVPVTYSSFGGHFRVHVSAAIWVGNAIKSAGRAVGKVDHAITDESGKIGRDLKKIPVVGGLLHGLYDLMFFVTMGPILLPEEVLISGGRIDRVALKALKETLQDFKETGAYAQMVCSLIPGVGTGIAAAIGCGLALANGQPISQAIVAGVEGALPGGPLARMALNVAADSVTAAVKHEKITGMWLAKEGISAAATAISLPPAAKSALEGAFSCGANIMRGEKLGKALVQGAIEEVGAAVQGAGANLSLNVLSLNVSPSVWHSAAGDACDLAERLSSGQRVDRAVLAEATRCTNLLPLPADYQRGITTGLGAAVAVAQKRKGESVESVLAMRLQHAVVDSMLEYGKQNLPPSAKQAISIGMATAHGKYVQALTATQLVGPVKNRLMNEGQQLLQSDPTLARTYSTVVTEGREGFQVGAGMMRHVIDPNQFLTVRQSLDEDERNGFDLATSLHIGRVSSPPSNQVADPTAQVGHYIVRGVQGGYPSQKEAQIAAVARHPVARVGAAATINRIHEERMSFWDKLLVFLGLKTRQEIS